jgi:hypothetical protein
LTEILGEFNIHGCAIVLWEIVQISTTNESMACTLAKDGLCQEFTIGYVCSLMVLSNDFAFETDSLKIEILF